MATKEQTLEAMKALLKQVKRCGRGLHTGNCATVPREIVRRPMDRSLDGHDEPMYTSPGKCDCGAVVAAKQVDDVLDSEEATGAQCSCFSCNHPDAVGWLAQRDEARDKANFYAAERDEAQAANIALTARDESRCDEIALVRRERDEAREALARCRDIDLPSAVACAREEQREAGRRHFWEKGHHPLTALETIALLQEAPLTGTPLADVLRLARGVIAGNTGPYDWVEMATVLAIDKALS